MDLTYARDRQNGIAPIACKRLAVFDLSNVGLHERKRRPNAGYLIEVAHFVPFTLPAPILPNGAAELPLGAFAPGIIGMGFFMDFDGLGFFMGRLRW